MNIVFVQHIGSPKEYCFSVPDHLTGVVKRGMRVMCKTARGEEIGIVKTGVITGDGAADIAKLHGAHFPLAEIDAAYASIPMDRIKISARMRDTIPATEKITQRIEEYKKDHAFHTGVALNSAGELVDGYSAYLVARMLGLKYIPVYTRYYFDNGGDDEGSKS